MLLQDLNWMDVEEYLKRDDRIILVTGSCEQHGYLSLLSDVRQPMAIATAAAERENVLVAPPLNFGVSSYFAAYPGTLSLSVETHNRVVCELVSELHRQGLRRVLVLNGHGGNGGMDFALREMVNRLPGLRHRHPSLVERSRRRPVLRRQQTDARARQLVGEFSRSHAWRMCLLATSPPPAQRPTFRPPRCANDWAMAVSAGRIR